MDDREQEDVARESLTKEQGHFRIEQGYGVAASLLWEDRRLLPLFLLVLGVLGLPKLAIDFKSTADVMRFALVDRLAELLFLGYLTHRTLTRITDRPVRATASTYLRLLLIGTFLWMGWAGPALLQATTDDPLLQGISFVLLLVGVVALLSLHFFFVPVMAGATDPAEIFRAARRYTIEDWALPLRAMVAPRAVALVLVTFTASLAGDSEGTGVLFAANIFNALQKVLASYLSVGFGIALLEAGSIRTLTPRPYYQAQLATLAVRSPWWIRYWLHLRNGVFLAFVGLILHASNELRLQHAPPSASVEILRAEAGNKVISVTLRAVDHKGRLRSFRPAFISLASKKGSKLSEGPSKILVNGEEHSPLSGLPDTTDPVTVVLEFPTDRTKAQAEQLEDLYLWYRSVNLAAVMLARPPSRTTPTAGREPQPRPPPEGGAKPPRPPGSGVQPFRPVGS